MTISQTQRKLIDLPLPIVRIIGKKAKNRSMSFKRYVEQLIEEDARQSDEMEAVPEEVTDENLIGLIGIARPLHTDAGSNDNRLQYILSKL